MFRDTLTFVLFATGILLFHSVRFCVAGNLTGRQCRGLDVHAGND